MLCVVVAFTLTAPRLRVLVENTTCGAGITAVPFTLRLFVPLPLCTDSELATVCVVVGVNCTCIVALTPPLPSGVKRIVLPNVLFVLDAIATFGITLLIVTFCR